MFGAKDTVSDYRGQEFILYNEMMGHVVAQLVGALHYKPEGRGCHWNFSLT